MHGILIVFVREKGTNISETLPERTSEGPVDSLSVILVCVWYHAQFVVPALYLIRLARCLPSINSFAMQNLSRILLFTINR